jgi:hypothetical protein
MSRRCLALLLLVLATNAGAQRIQLEMRPRRDDTLHMRLDQTLDMAGARRGEVSRQEHTTLSMYSRAIVERAVATGSVILAIADSVRMSTTDEHAQVLGDDVRRQIEGRRMRMWLSPDGTVEMLDARLPRDVSDLVSVMPGSFPREPVAVGDTWVRVMPVPPAARMGLPLGGAVRAIFQLDSLSGDLAYLSLHGTMHQDAQSGNDNPSTVAGDVSGSMILDRRRGWLSETRFLIQLRATVKPPNAPASTPMSFTMKVSQHMTVLESGRP